MPPALARTRNVHDPHQRDGASADEGRCVQSLENGISVAAPASAEMCAFALPLSAHGCRDKEALGFLGCCQGDVRRTEAPRAPHRPSKEQKIAEQGEEPSASNLQQESVFMEGLRIKESLRLKQIQFLCEPRAE